TPMDAALCQGTGGSVNYGTRLQAWQMGDPGTPMLKRTLNSQAGARCNDGSPAVMYLRPAPIGSPDGDKWIIHLDGGGGCRDVEDCRDRWCSLGGQVFDVAGKMSSLGAHDAISENQGLFSPVTGNAFRGFNHVLVHYCSSDNWIGSALPGEPVDPKGQQVSYDIELQGEAIVADVFGTLHNGPTWADPGPLSEYYDRPMPDLDTASVVIVSGDSAGGGGVRHHIDKIRDRLMFFNPGVSVYAFIDAGVGPALYDPALSWSNSPYNDYLDMMDSEKEPTVRGFWRADDSALDQSCLNLAPDPLYCLDTVYTLENHITTPFAVRQDLTDPLPMPRLVGEWKLFADSEAFARASADQLVILRTAGIEPRPDASVFGPNCGKHIAIRDNGGFALTTTTSSTGNGLPWHDLVVNWLTGAAPDSDVQTDNPALAGYSGSNCH
ncbi:MAG TPA: pectin acetylesterase-family hydrolase, partial [Myxococcaceae bacterium]|nr:pectin acetylesterase-family hydrolase [Myxococcaceae bacterium]